MWARMEGATLGVALLGLRGGGVAQGPPRTQAISDLLAVHNHHLLPGGTPAPELLYDPNIAQ